jgi:hypothetical protein
LDKALSRTEKEPPACPSSDQGRTIIRLVGRWWTTLIQALIEKLPPAGPWSADERLNWLKLLTMAFQIAYGQVEEIEIKKKEAAN